MVQQMSPKRTKHACGVWIGVDCRFCAGCGEENPDYDKEIASLLRQGHRAGWKKPEPSQECEPPADADHSRLPNQLGDLMKDLRRRSDTDAPSSNAVAPPATVPVANTAELSKPLHDKEKEAPKEEFDLDSPEEVVEYLKLFWGESKAKDVEGTLQFAVQTMKARATKSEPLCQLVQKEVLQTKELMKKEGRLKFLKFWENKRSARFAQRPDFAKGK